MKRGVVLSAVLLIPMAVACWNTERDFGTPSDGVGGGAGGPGGSGEEGDIPVNPVPTEFVEEVSPAEDASKVSTTTTVVISLSDEASGTVEVTLTGPEGEIAGKTKLDGDTITFTPSDDLVLLADYTVLVLGELEIGGESVELDFGWKFSTADGTWGEPVLVDALDTPVLTGKKLGFAANGNGMAAVAWEQEVDGLPSVVGNMLVDGVWLGATPLEKTAATEIEIGGVSVALSDAGDAVALWLVTRSAAPMDLLGAKFDADSSSWLEETPTETTTTMPVDDQYATVMDAEGTLHLLWREADGDAFLSTMAPGSGTWSDADLVSASTQTDVGISLAIQPNGDASAVWVRPSYSDYNQAMYRSEGTWGEPSTIGGNNARTAVVTPHLLGTETSEFIIWSDETRVWASAGNAGTWDVSPTPLSAAVTLASMPSMAVSSDGVPVVAWWADDGTRKAVQSASFSNGQWQSAEDIDEPSDAGCQNYLTGDEPLIVEAGADGDVFAGYQCSDGAVVEVWVNRFHQGAWQGGHRLGFAGSNELGLRLAFDPFNRGIASWYRCASSSCELLVSRFDGTEWLAPETIEEETGWIYDVRLAARDNGSFLVVFDDQRNGDLDDLFAIEFAGH